MGRNRPDLESRLRRAKADPRREFIDGLADRLDAGRPRRGRLGLALAATAVAVAAFGATGGLGYAASTVSIVVTNPITLVKAVVAPTPPAPAPAALPQPAAAQQPAHHDGDHGHGGGDDHGHGGDDDHNPSHDQYRPGKGCGDRNHVHSRDNECHDDGHGGHGH